MEEEAPAQEGSGPFDQQQQQQQQQLSRQGSEGPAAHAEPAAEHNALQFELPDDSALRVSGRVRVVVGVTALW